MAFTSNAWFIQDAFNPDKPGLANDKRAERKATRERWAAHHLRQWLHSEAVPNNEVCVFTGLPAAPRELSGKLSGGRIGRNQMPLLQGDDAINFFPNGDSGLPISGIALLALQLFPLGCAKCGVGLMAVHSNSEQITYELASHFLNRNIHAITQAQAAGEDKLPSAQRSLKTLLIEVLIDADQRRARAERRKQPASLTAYNFNNGKSPSLEIYHLPLEIVGFLQAAHTPVYSEGWELLVRRSWQLPPVQKGKMRGDDPNFEPRRNMLYEDLFTLPDTASRFIRTYFLRMPVRTSFEDDPRRGYALRNELELISWPLIELFLRKVVGMDEDRIKRIGELGDRLAQYVRTQGGKRFFRAFFTEQRPGDFRALLIKANIAHIKAGHPPLFDLDAYIFVFEEGYEVMQPDWRLARDLVLMRMIDRLRDWLHEHPDAAPEPEPTEAEAQITA
jgi:CRISPR-associated protein Cst1